MRTCGHLIVGWSGVVRYSGESLPCTAVLVSQRPLYHDGVGTGRQERLYWRQRWRYHLQHGAVATATKRALVRAHITVHDKAIPTIHWGPTTWAMVRPTPLNLPLTLMGYPAVFDSSKTMSKQFWRPAVMASALPVAFRTLFTCLFIFMFGFVRKINSSSQTVWDIQWVWN